MNMAWIFFFWGNYTSLSTIHGLNPRPQHRAWIAALCPGVHAALSILDSRSVRAIFWL
jgi:hypothetical protein